MKYMHRRRRKHEDKKHPTPHDDRAFAAAVVPVETKGLPKFHRLRSFFFAALGEPLLRHPEFTRLRRGRRPRGHPPPWTGS